MKETKWGWWDWVSYISSWFYFEMQCSFYWTMPTASTQPSRCKKHYRKKVHPMHICRYHSLETICDNATIYVTRIQGKISFELEMQAKILCHVCMLKILVAVTEADSAIMTCKRRMFSLTQQPFFFSLLPSSPTTLSLGEFTRAPPSPASAFLIPHAQARVLINTKQGRSTWILPRHHLPASYPPCYNHIAHTPVSIYTYICPAPL